MAHVRSTESKKSLASQAIRIYQSRQIMQGCLGKPPICAREKWLNKHRHQTWKTCRSQATMNLVASKEVFYLITGRLWQVHRICSPASLWNQWRRRQGSRRRLSQRLEKTIQTLTSKMLKVLLIRDQHQGWWRVKVTQPQDRLRSLIFKRALSVRSTLERWRKEDCRKIPSLSRSTWRHRILAQ